eukprot:COSAG02_NODE_157_length_32999_cov_31.863647_24_plen_107_part_00
MSLLTSSVYACFVPPHARRECSLEGDDVVTLYVVYDPPLLDNTVPVRHRVPSAAVARRRRAHSVGHKGKHTHQLRRVDAARHKVQWIKSNGVGVLVAVLHGHTFQL